jgi:hypothetical protein
MPVLLPCARRFITRFIFVCLAGFLALGAAMAADPKSEPGQIEARQDEPASLTFWNREVAILRADIGGITPAERVARIQGKIANVLAAGPGNKADAVPGTFANLTGYWIKIDGNPIFGLVPEDADGMTGETLDEQVRRTVATLQEALDARREQRSLPLILEGAGLGAVATLLLGGAALGGGQAPRPGPATSQSADPDPGQGWWSATAIHPRQH